MRRIICGLLSIICCVVFAIGAKAAPKVLADVMLKNGKEYDNVEIKLPKGWDKKLNIKVEGKKLTFPADSIDRVVFWHVKNPDNKQLLCYHEYAIFNDETDEYTSPDKKLRKKGLYPSQWFTLHYVGEDVYMWTTFASIKAGDNSVTYSGSLDSPYFFHKKNGRFFVHIPFNRIRPGMTRNWLIAFFADDEVLSETLKDKKELYDRDRKNSMRNGTVYTPYKYEDIADQYKAGRKK